MAIPVVAIIAGSAIGMGIGSAMPPVQRAISYPLNRLIPNEVLAAPEAIEAYLREVIGPDQLAFDIKSVGLSEKRIAWLLKVREQLFSVIDAIVLWRREEIGDGELAARLKHVGIPENDVGLWVKFTETRPNVQDIIRFAVREVYSPDVAAAFGQFEGAGAVSATAEKDLKAAGIRPEDLAKYWAAHWELPSVQMGYEMLHRGVIGSEQLDMLMRALDVMPFWRDKLKQISYNPLTRVDVRRMHKTGIISEGELLKCYMDLGYNAENAQRLADFTVKYNANPEAAEETQDDKGKAKEKDLTKADLMSGFADGLFYESEISDALLSLGYSQDEVDYYISRVKYEQDKDMVGKYIKAYHDAYINNSMSHNEVVDKLNELNLSGKRVENLFNLWDIERSIRTQKPTKAEILTFLRKKVISKATAITELKGLGYNDTYIGWYLATT